MSTCAECDRYMKKCNNLHVEIRNLKRDRDSAQQERDEARIDKTRLAAWLNLHHPEVFRSYFMKVD